MNDRVRGEREEREDAIALDETGAVRLLEGQIEEGQGRSVCDLRRAGKGGRGVGNVREERERGGGGGWWLEEEE